MLSSSRPPSPLPDDHDRQLEEFVQVLTSQREAVGSELDVLRSIYGDRSVRVWASSTSKLSNSNEDTDTVVLRYEIDTKWAKNVIACCLWKAIFVVLINFFGCLVKKSLPSHEDIHIQLLVSLPATYPESSPPQLQLLSRYIGAFGVDSSLFGAVLRTYISSHSKVEFVPDTVAVFDGLQHVVELCDLWYEERLSEGAVGELIREEERGHKPPAYSGIPHPVVSNTVAKVEEKLPMTINPLSIPELIEAEPIVDRKSVFIGRACRISHPSQVSISFKRVGMFVLSRPSLRLKECWLTCYPTDAWHELHIQLSMPGDALWTV